MKIQRKVSGTTIVEAEGATVAEVFEKLAQLEEIFSGHEVCGLCHQTGVHYQVRTDAQGNKYYQAVCNSCAAEFRFGVKKTPPGCLFPQMKDKDGQYKANGGWAKWQAQQAQGDAYEGDNDRQQNKDISRRGY